MTASPSEATTFDLDAFAAEIAEAVGGQARVAHGTAKVVVAPEGWTDALTTARDGFGLGYFSWLSAVDWTTDVEVGDPPAEETPERIEVLCAVGDLTGRLVIFSTDLDHDEPRLASLVPVYPGANWHEREAAEMFGIVFEGHPQLEHLYLPEGFVGHPLRKSFPLLSREVKPWPGTVDVEDMPSDDAPSTENPEA